MEKRLLRLVIGNLIFSLWFTPNDIGLPIRLFIGYGTFSLSILCFEFGFD